MRDFKFWINAYSEVSGEYSNGWNDLDSAWADYRKQLEKVEKDGGEVEFLEIQVVISHKERNK